MGKPALRTTRDVGRKRGQKSRKGAAVGGGDAGELGQLAIGNAAIRRHRVQDANHTSLPFFAHRGDGRSPVPHLIALCQGASAHNARQHTSTRSHGPKHPGTASFQKAARLALESEPQHDVWSDCKEITGIQVVGRDVHQQVLSQRIAWKLQPVIGRLTCDQQLSRGAWGRMPISSSAEVLDQLQRGLRARGGILGAPDKKSRDFADRLPVRISGLFFRLVDTMLVAGLGTIH